MARQSQKQLSQQQKIVDDIKFLLSNIRARQNGLIFFLEMFTSNSRATFKPELYQIYKHQFLQKQKIYTNQIMQLIQKLSSEKTNKQIYCQISQIKAFWIKLKSILRVTLQRAKLLGLLTNNLATKYQQIINFINEAQQNSHQIKQFIKIEQLIKKRTIQALIATKNLFSQNIINNNNNEQNKNRSETFLKLNNKPMQSINFSPVHYIPKHQELFRAGESVEVKALNKLKSLTRVRKKQQKIKPKNSANDIKRTQSAILKYQMNLTGVMECRCDYKLDKQKSKLQNENQLYDLMFDRNIANHKIITKFIHNAYKLSSFMNKMKHNNQKQRNVQSQKKYNKGARQFKDIKDLKEIIKNQTNEDLLRKRQKIQGKNLRPKTTKQRKIIVRKIQGGKCDGTTQLINA